MNAHTLITSGSMAPILHLLLLLLVLCLLTTMVSHGLKLKLIHRDAVDSPFRTNNLTTLQKLELDVQTSMHAASILEGGNNIHPLNSRALMLHRSNPIYIILVAIGKPGIVQRLSFDITQSFTWAHCAPCISCPVPLANLFVPELSINYRKVLDSDPACAWIPYKIPQEGFCGFNYTFPPSNTYILGTLSRDILSIPMVSTTANPAPADLIDLPSFSFGCAHNSTTNPGPGNAGVNGVFGLGHHPISILKQSSLQVPLSFSYCLVCPDTYPGIQSYLRFFGDSVVPRQRSYRVTRIENHVDDIFGSYYLTLKQLSFNGMRLLNAQTSQFNRRRGKGGVVISTTTTVTFLIRPVYEIVRQRMLEYAEIHGWTSLEQTIVALDLCYELGSVNMTKPTMKFHFANYASLLVEPTELFVTHMSRIDSFFCLNILPSDSTTIIGTRMQHNYRFYFDVRLKQLTFHREDCHLEGQAGK